MCDFHSIVGVHLGDDKYELLHTSDNSHSNMIAAFSRDLKNKPYSKTVLFEAEWDGDGELPPDSKLIRNIGECPERLVRKILTHYKRLSEALTDGSHLCEGGYFEDTKKWCDVWNKAIAKGIPVALPKVFRGNLAVSGSAKLDAPALIEVGGYLAVYGSAKLDAPALIEVGGDLAVYGSAKLDAPALIEVGGYLDVSGSAKLDALTKVGGYLAVYGSAKLDALTKVGGNLAVSGSAKLDAPALIEVGGYLDVSGELIAPKLKRR